MTSSVAHNFSWYTTLPNIHKSYACLQVRLENVVISTINSRRLMYTQQNFKEFHYKEMERMGTKQQLSLHPLRITNIFLLSWLNWLLVYNTALLSVIPFNMHDHNKIYFPLKFFNGEKKEFFPISFLLCCKFLKYKESCILKGEWYCDINFNLFYNKPALICRQSGKKTHLFEVSFFNTDLPEEVMSTSPNFIWTYVVFKYVFINIMINNHA